MRRRLLLIASIACFTFVGGAAALGAGGTATGGWYWADQVTPPPGTVQQKLPSPDVPAGDLAVSARNGDSNKETYLHLADDLIQPGDKVTSLVLTLKRDSAAGNVNDTNALIVAVPVTDFWVDGAQGDPYGVKPPRGTTPAIVGKESSGTWTFDITPIAQQWASGTLQNNGIALAPKDGSGASFEVVWSPKPTVAADVTPASGSASNDAASTGPSSSAGSDTSGSGSSASVSPSLGTGSSDLSPAGGSTGSVTPSAPVAPAPTTTAPAAVGLRRARSSHPGRGIPATFFLAVILVAGLLAAAMMSLGPLGEPAAARKGSVLRRLERRPDTAS